MLLNTVIGNLHNLKTDRYHPIVFDSRPLPSDDGSERMTRYKSRGHHTAGFDIREEAIEDCRSLCDKMGSLDCTEKDFPWDGEDIPAMVVFFGEVDGKVQPVMF